MRRYRRLRAWPRRGRVRFGDLRRLDPFSRTWGFDRGLPIDRYYIADFLGRQSKSAEGTGLVQGQVLEIGNADYAPGLGDTGSIERIDILDASANNPDATVIAD